MSVTAQTWECGTPKSQGNAFSWVRPFTKEDADLERKRAIDRASYHRRKEIAKRAATRVNKCVDLGAHGGTANSIKGR